MWAIINLDSVEYNFRAIKGQTDSKICCVVKADAYGHNAIKLAQFYQSLGADCLAVSNIEEALQLRNNAISLPILVLGYTPPECAKLLADNDISQSVYSKEYASELVRSIEACNSKIKIHIKLDTGMGRIGFSDNEQELDSIAEICSHRLVVPEGIFTHFAVADCGDSGEEYTDMQYRRFLRVVDDLGARGIKFGVVHCSNSAGILDFSKYHLDMVRAGIILYGLSPSSDVKNAINLKRAMAMYTVISHIKTVKKGESVSYGRTFIADRPMKIATVPIGYADGFWRNNGNMKYSLKVGDRYAPILGRICMDQLMIDVTDIDCALGDEVLVFGDDAKCSADEIARINNTINYEVVCAVGARVPRVFIKNGRVVDVSDLVYN